MSASSLLARDLDAQPTGVVLLTTPGRLAGVVVINQAVAARYLKIYDKATAPTQADTPKLTIPIAASGERSFTFVEPVRFASGISIRGTTGVADNDTGAPNANDIISHVFYD